MRIYGIKKKNIFVYRLLASKLVKKKKKELKKLRLKLRLFNTLGKGKMFYLKSSIIELFYNVFDF